MQLISRFFNPVICFAAMAIVTILLAAFGTLNRDTVTVLLLVHVLFSLTASILTHAWPTRLSLAFIAQSVLTGLCYWLLPEAPEGSPPVLIVTTGVFVPAAFAASLIRWSIIRHLPSMDPDAPPPPVSDRTARIAAASIAGVALVGTAGLAGQAIDLAALTRPVAAQEQAVPRTGAEEALPSTALLQILLSSDPLPDDSIVTVEITNTSDFVVGDLEIEARAIDALGLSRGRVYFRIGEPQMPLAPDARLSLQLELPETLYPLPENSNLRLTPSFASGI